MKVKQYLMSASLVAGAALTPYIALATPATKLHITALSGTPDNPTQLITKFVNILLSAAGIIAVVMIIVGGIMYSLSAGDSGKATKAKDAILYSVIGLVITMLAYAIVGFITTTIK